MGCLLLGFARVPGGFIFQAVAAAGDRDDLGMVQESVQDGGGRRDIPQEFAPPGATLSLRPSHNRLQKMNGEGGIHNRPFRFMPKTAIWVASPFCIGN